MSDLAPLLISTAVAVLMVPLGLRALAAAGNTRENYRGRAVAFPAGVVAVTASIVALGAMMALDRLADTSLLLADGDFLVLFGSVDRASAWLFGAGPAVAVMALGVALLGLADDLLGAAGRGWRGHAAAVRRGELSTGAIKAVGTLALAAVVLAPVDDYVVAVVLVALTTNLFNLLDLRPGRSVKTFAALGAALCVAGHTEPLRELGVWAGPLLVVGVFDLRERAMLGDTGSNVLGALAGLWMVFSFDATGQVVALAVVLVLTVYGELRSFTRTIEGIPPLRWLDELGRPPQDAA